MNINDAKEVSAFFSRLRVAGALVVIRALPLPQGAARGSSVLSALADSEYEVAADGTLVCVKDRGGADVASTESARVLGALKALRHVITFDKEGDLDRDDFDGLLVRVDATIAEAEAR